MENIDQAIITLFDSRQAQFTKNKANELIESVSADNMFYKLAIQKIKEVNLQEVNAIFCMHWYFQYLIGLTDTLENTSELEDLVSWILLKRKEILEKKIIRNLFGVLYTELLFKNFPYSIFDLISNSSTNLEIETLLSIMTSVYERSIESNKDFLVDIANRTFDIFYVGLNREDTELKRNIMHTLSVYCNLYTLDLVYKMMTKVFELARDAKLQDHVLKYLMHVLETDLTQEELRDLISKDDFIGLVEWHLAQEDIDLMPILNFVCCLGLKYIQVRIYDKAEILAEKALQYLEEDDAILMPFAIEFADKFDSDTAKHIRKRIQES